MGKYLTKLSGILTAFALIFPACHAAAEEADHGRYWAGHEAVLSGETDGAQIDCQLTIKYSSDGLMYSAFVEVDSRRAEPGGKCSGKVDKFGNLERKECTPGDWRQRDIVGTVWAPKYDNVMEAKNFIADIQDFGKRYPQKIDAILIATHFSAATKETTGMEYTASSSAFFNLALGMSKNKNFIDFYIEAKKQRQEMERVERKKLRAAIENKRFKISQRIQKDPFSKDAPELVNLLKTYPLPGPKMPSREIKKKYQNFLNPVVAKQKNKVVSQASSSEGEAGNTEGIISQHWSVQQWQKWLFGKKFRSTKGDLYRIGAKDNRRFNIEYLSGKRKGVKCDERRTRSLDELTTLTPCDKLKILFEGVQVFDGRKVKDVGATLCSLVYGRCFFVYRTKDKKEKLMIQRFMRAKDKRRQSMDFTVRDNTTLHTRDKFVLRSPMVDQEKMVIVRKRESEEQKRQAKAQAMAKEVKKRLAWIKTYAKRKKTILETVLNYANFGDEGGIIIKVGGQVWDQKGKCKLQRVSVTKNKVVTSKIFDLRKINVTAFRFGDKGISQKEILGAELMADTMGNFFASSMLAASPRFYSGDRKYFNILGPQDKIDYERVKNAWGLAFKQCPGKKSRF